MSSVVGIDLSSKAIDLVKLDENTNAATWTHVDLAAPGAWARTLSIGPGIVLDGFGYWDDVYLVAIEAPYGRGQAGTLAILNRVVGALAASLPRELRQPERCWLVRPDEWKTGLRLKSKPDERDITRLFDRRGWWAVDQNARDAACLALWARNENAKGVAA